MDWWQVVLIVLAAIIAGLLIGGLLSYLIARLLKKPFFKKREASAATEGQVEFTAPALVAQAATEGQPGSSAPTPVLEAKGNRLTQLLKKPFLKKPEATPVVEKQLKSTAPDLIAELIRKREIIEQQIKEQAKQEAEEARKAKVTEERARTEAEVVGEPLKSLAPDLVTEVENNRRIAVEPWAGKLQPFQTSVWDTTQNEVHKLPANLREDLTQAYVDMRLANSIVWLSTELGRRSQNLDDNYTKLCTSIGARLDKTVPLLRQSGK